MNPVSIFDSLVSGRSEARTRAAASVFSRRILSRLFVVALLLSDVLAIVFALGLAFWLRFQSGLPIFRLQVEPSLSYYLLLVAAIVPLWLAIFAVIGLYHPDNLLGGTREYALVFRATTVGLLLVIVAGFLEPDLVVARGWLLLAWALSFLFTSINRFVLRRVVYRLRTKGYFLRPALLVGANDEGLLMADQLRNWSTSGIDLIGVVSTGNGTGGVTDGGVEILGSLADLENLIRKHDVLELILATSALTREQILRVFKEYGISKDVQLRLSSGLFEIITTGLRVKEMAYVPLVSVNKVRLTGADRILKASLDFALAIPGLLLLSPLLLLIVILVKLDSDGPVIYRRRVMGLNGRQFDAFKFRTMYSNSEEILADRPELRAELHREHKIKDDPRVTRVGKFLRKYSLDELPQLLNVIRREMSLVGPRMISPQEMPKYNQWGINLLTVRPGITGLWQVSGRSDLDYSERVQLDMYYIRNWSIWLDLQLLMQTIPAVLRSRGAY